VTIVDVRASGVRWIRARDERDRLEKERNAFLCAHEYPPVDEPPDSGGTMAVRDGRDGRVCWKGQHETDGDGSHWVYNRDPEHWCASCNARAEVHERFRAARNLANALRGALTKACMRAAQESPAPDSPNRGTPAGELR
jgi:hypothetical protein